MRAEPGYFEWMYRLVSHDERVRRLSYRKLLRRLYETEFTWTMRMDANRAENGINLRDRFGLSSRDDYDKPCSVLEMMIALAIRCEERIMDNDEEGDRTARWFWDMIFNMNLRNMTDSNFDRHYVDDAVYFMLSRQYEPDGRGGLFTVTSHREDMRTIDIWYQMCWYLNDIIEKGE